ncbi:MAG TPA: hypothetical protein VHP83_11155 [Aggregatilineaceae bacterium]|nr:hypothetical protein [Aggregatilineaceae bacterium]
MATVHQVHLGSENTSVQQGRSSHGRWRYGFQRATVTPEGLSGPISSTLHLIQDANRFVFVLANGAAADGFSQRLADYLWMVEDPDGGWPQNVRDWLADTSRWPDVPNEATQFVCGRIERQIAGGRLLLAWLGMNGVRLIDRAGTDVTLDVMLLPEEHWTPARGPEPVGMALHAYRGSLFGLARLLVFTESTRAVGDELPDLSMADLDQALVDWSEEAEQDLAFLDLRLTPVLSGPDAVLVTHRWVSAELCELSWSAAPTANAYRIEQSSSPTFEDATLLAELTDARQQRYTFSPQASGSTYYRVIPLNQGVMGAPSDAVSVTPMSLTPPIMEAVQWSEEGGYSLRWSPIPQATSYEVQTSSDPDFDNYGTEIVYRGESAETLLPRDTLPNRYYRVRAINSLYAPHSPSPWSRSRRAPARLNTPTFTEVSQRRLVWTPVPGTRQYVVHVTAKGQDEASGEDFFTIEPTCAVADEPAIYRVRAMRSPDDIRTASEWSEAVTVSPPEVFGAAPRASLPFSLPVLLAAAVVAVVVGVALGWGGLSVYQDTNATATRTPLSEVMIQATTAVASTQVSNATSVVELGQQNTQLNRTLNVQATGRARQTATAARWTMTPTASNTPNLTETFAAAFVGAQTSTAAFFTETPTPTNTPNLTETFEVAFVGAQTSTAALFTETPTPTDTPNLTETFAAAFVAAQTATAEFFTETPTATITPNFTEMFEAALISAQTATALGWTATPTITVTPRPSPTANMTATVNAMLPPGCFILTPPENLLPVYAEIGDMTPIMETVRPLAQVFGLVEVRSKEDGELLEIWLQVRTIETSGTAIGWVQLPEGRLASDLYGGPGCDPATDVPVRREYR